MSSHRQPGSPDSTSSAAARAADRPRRPLPAWVTAPPTGALFAAPAPATPPTTPVPPAAVAPAVSVAPPAGAHAHGRREARVAPDTSPLDPHAVVPDYPPQEELLPPAPTSPVVHTVPLHHAGTDDDRPSAARDAAPQRASDPHAAGQQAAAQAAAQQAPPLQAAAQQAPPQRAAPRSDAPEPSTAGPTPLAKPAAVVLPPVLPDVEPTRAATPSAPVAPDAGQPRFSVPGLEHVLVEGVVEEPSGPVGYRTPRRFAHQQAAQHPVSDTPPLLVPAGTSPAMPVSFNDLVSPPEITQLSSFGLDDETSAEAVPTPTKRDRRRAAAEARATAKRDRRRTDAEAKATALRDAQAQRDAEARPATTSEVLVEDTPETSTATPTGPAADSAAEAPAEPVAEPTPAHDHRAAGTPGGSRFSLPRRRPAATPEPGPMRNGASAGGAVPMGAEPGLPDGAATTSEPPTRRARRTTVEPEARAVAAPRVLVTPVTSAVLAALLGLLALGVAGWWFTSPEVVHAAGIVLGAVALGLSVGALRDPAGPSWQRTAALLGGVVGTVGILVLVYAVALTTGAGLPDPTGTGTVPTLAW